MCTATCGEKRDVPREKDIGQPTTEERNEGVVVVVAYANPTHYALFVPFTQVAIIA